MKKHCRILMLVVCAAVSAGSVAAENMMALPAAAQMQQTQLSQNELAGLLLMREEEKLAHDVYKALYRQWQQPIFANISRSEAQHMAAMGRLLQRYGVADPQQAGAGQFSDAALQKLYHEMVERGSLSRTDALKVGAMIEELDISDLNRLSAQTRQADILNVYAQLNRGSRNHLRSFERQLQQAGAVFQPQHLSAAQYREIVNAPMERGRH